jgi:hypothetical protein
MKRENREVPAPKRRPTRSDGSDSKKHYRPTMGQFPSIKMGCMVTYTSQIEHDLLYILDFHPQVIEFKERPYAFEYPHISELKKEAYLPDYLVRTPERTLIVECLAHRVLDTRATKDRHAGLRLWCATNTYGLEFTYVTERTLRSGCYLSNVKLLTQFSRHSVDAPTRATIFNILESDPLQLTIGQVAMQLSPDFPDDAIPDLLHLVYNGELYVPLQDWVVTGDSPICLPYQLPTSIIPPPNFHTNIPALAFLDGCDGPQVQGGR